jgi:predicted phage tail protein
MTTPRLFNKTNGTWLRSVLRAAVLVATAFGLKLTVDQVAAIQLAIEAVLAGATNFTAD